MAMLPFSSHHSRRAFLRNGLYAAGGAAALVAGGVGWRAREEDVFEPFDGPAYQPWTAWRKEPMDGPVALLQMAILAASPHNTQPWLFHLHGNRIKVLADRSRHLGTFDPYRREMQIGIGCAIENMIVAAPAHGYAAEVRHVERQLTKDPGDEAMIAAAITLHEADRERTPLFEAIPRRHTDRNAYDRTRPVPAHLTRAFAEFSRALDVRIDLFEAGPAREAFDAVVSDATAAIVADHAMERDSQRWFRKGPAAIAAHRDGLTLDTMGIPPLMLFAAKMLPPADAETTHRYWLTQTREVHLATARMTGLISVRDRYSASQNLAAGRVWQHMHLMATAEGISMQPLNQPVEMADREKEEGKAPGFAERLAELTGSAEWQPTFAFRLGQPERNAPPSPRRGVEDRMI